MIAHPGETWQEGQQITFGEQQVVEADSLLGQPPPSKDAKRRQLRKKLCKMHR
jgi:hypothetical protein